MSNLYAAHHNWARRPADQTFTSIDDLHRAVTTHRVNSRSSTVPLNSLRVEAQDGEVYLTGRTGARASLTNWSFGQLAARAGAPPSYLRDLPATLAAQNLNYGLSQMGNEAGDEANGKLLLSSGETSFSLRAITSDSYTRIWNNDVTSRVQQLIQHQPYWRLPKAYDRHNGMVGKPDENGMVTRGAYASDRDLFIFMIDEDRAINVPGSNPIKRGFFMWNSEVGAKSFGITTFLYDHLCGNNICWGVSDVKTIRIRHTGEANSKAYKELATQVRNYAASSSQQLEAQIVKAQGFLLGKDKEEVVSTALARRIPELTKGRLEKAFDVAESTPRYGDPRSVWAMVNGLTEISQESENTDTRTQHDMAAGKLLDIVF